MERLVLVEVFHPPQDPDLNKSNLVPFVCGMKMGIKKQMGLAWRFGNGTGC